MLDENVTIILVRDDMSIDGIPDKLERWRKAIEEFVVTNFHTLPPSDPDYVFIVRARLIEIEESTLIQQLCVMPAYALKRYRLIGGLLREVQS